jgi:hypothetical protein
MLRDVVAVAVVLGLQDVKVTKRGNTREQRRRQDVKKKEDGSIA